MKGSKSDSKKSKKSKKAKEYREKKLIRKEEKKKRKEEKRRVKLVKKQLADEKIRSQLAQKCDDMKIPKPAEKKNEDCGPPICLMNRGSRPETKAEYDKRQSLIKRVHDPETGRIRLIKGDGEILEEIVCKDQHKKINKHATESDGRFFQQNTLGSAYSDH